MFRRSSAPGRTGFARPAYRSPGSDCLLGRGRRGRICRGRAGCRARGWGRRGAPRGGPSARASAAATDGDRAWNRQSTSLPSRLSPAPPTRSFSPMNATVGLVVGREWSFPPKFIEEVNGRDRGVVAEYAKLGAERMHATSAYAVIIDRISHEVPFYRTYLKHAVLQGVTVINNPFMWSADDKFFGATLATRLGVASPKTVVLPNKEYIPGISHEESLRNLVFPLDWDAVLRHIGLPCILKDAHGGGWKDVFVCRTPEELLHHYDHSGLRTMIVQEFIEWEQFVRCLGIGQQDVLPIHYDPAARKYHVDPGYLDPALRDRIVQDSLTLVRALGYDINSLTPEYFDWAVRHMADLAIRLATRRPAAKRAFHWQALCKGRSKARPT